MAKKKSTSKAVKDKYRRKPEVQAAEKAYMKDYYRRADVSKRRKAYLAKPEVKAARKAARIRYEAKAENRLKRRKRLTTYADSDKGKATVKAWRARSKHKLKLYRRTAQLKKYKLTIIQFNAMLRKQRGRCALCKQKFAEGDKPVVDHCHLTGVVRGLLHNKCNRGLGLLGDTVHGLQAAILYLKAHSDADCN
jgi:hypothetical protein